MKIKQYNSIKRVEYPRWAGWKLLDFCDVINLNLLKDTKEFKIISILEENFLLFKKLESILKLK